ncbi:hypothetical protein JZ751_007519 [Albula glossodonta]|uniref:Uncharacterized protein n=1 Tax=Albula glossodonta TaxID=121402 RepID=A0A8T2MNF8_9TELE|nr:hypothetical protein JZ751_007519 [Albula glossodonta]
MQPVLSHSVQEGSRTERRGDFIYSAQSADCGVGRWRGGGGVGFSWHMQDSEDVCFREAWRAEGSQDQT